MTVDVINNVLENLRIDVQLVTKLVNVALKGPLLQKLKLWSLGSSFAGCKVSSVLTLIFKHSGLIIFILLNHRTESEQRGQTI